MEPSFVVHKYARSTSTSSTQNSVQAVLNQGRNVLSQTLNTRWFNAVPSKPILSIDAPRCYFFSSHPPSIDDVHVKNSNEHGLQAWGTKFTETELGFRLDDLDEFEGTNFDYLSEQPRPSKTSRKRLKLYAGSLFKVIPYPHLFPSSFVRYTDPGDLTPYQREPIPIPPYTFSTLPISSPTLPNFARYAWIIPVRGVLPWRGATAAAVLEPLPGLEHSVMSNSPTSQTLLPSLSSSSLQDPSITTKTLPKLLPIPSDTQKNLPILWTHDSLQKFWAWLCLLREKLAVGPIGMSFQMARNRYSGHSCIDIEVGNDGEFDAETEHSGLGPDPFRVDNSSRVEETHVLLGAADHIKIYHDASKSMGVRNVLDSWAYCVLSEVVSPDGSNRVDVIEVVEGTGEEQEEEELQKKRKGPKLRPLRGARLVLVDELSEGILIA